MIKINILTRTSNRPLGFKICAESIQSQTYENINHIVSYDSDEDLKYIKDFENIIKIKIDKEVVISRNTSVKPNNPNHWYSPHNLYCNELLDMVEDGWVLFLDDDDMLIDKHVITKIVNMVEDEDTIMVWKMRYPNGYTLPNDYAFKIKQPIEGNIGSPCFMFHSKWKDKARWDAYKCSDFRFISQLYKIIPKNNWIPIPFIQLNNSGGLGKREDIK